MASSAGAMEEGGVALMDVPSTLNDQRLRQNSARRLFDLSHGILFATVLVALLFLFLLFTDNIRQRQLQAQLKSELAVSARGLVGPPQAEPGDIVPAFESVSLADGSPRKSFTTVNRSICCSSCHWSATHV